MPSDLLLSTVHLQVSSTSETKIPYTVFFDCTFGMCLVQVFKAYVVISNSKFR